MQHRILINRERLKEFKPRYIPVSRAAMQPLKDFLAEWKRLGIAEEGTGLTATSMMSVPKKQNEIRWVSDLRPRNAITDKDHATLPNMEMIIEEVANCLQKPTELCPYWTCPTPITRSSATRNHGNIIASTHHLEPSKLKSCYREIVTLPQP